MKKLIIPVFLLLITLQNVLAQDPSTPAATPATTPPPATPAPAASQTQSEIIDDQALMFGIKLTPAFCWFTLDRNDYKSDGVYVGYIYGIMTDFRLAKNYYISSGLEISQRGGKYTSDSLVVDANTNQKAKGTVTQKLQYLDIPLTLKLKTNEIGYMRYYGTFGFLTGFTLKARQDKDYDDEQFEDRDKRDNMSDFGAFNFGLLVGAGFEYNFSGNSALSVGLQYHGSFVDVWSDDNAKINPNYVSLNLGLFF